MDGGADWSEGYEFLACEDPKEVVTGMDQLMTLRFSTTYKWLTADGRLPLSTSASYRSTDGCCRSRMMLSSLRLFNSREHGVRCNALQLGIPSGVKECAIIVWMCAGGYMIKDEKRFAIFDLPEVDIRVQAFENDYYCNSTGSLSGWS